MEGCPYDNAVAEATYKIIKPEFVKKRHFESLEELQREFTDYVHWFNHLRIHGTLDDLSQWNTNLYTLRKLSSLVLTIQ
ncbi:IS3 family transposase [Bacillus sp. WMMC1349]|nr:IS3 family transposase [Bacillus sp. WMMC1349]